MATSFIISFISILTYKIYDVCIQITNVVYITVHYAVVIFAYKPRN